MKIGAVGDLSGGDPALLFKTLTAALIACDYVIQLGDIMPGFSQVASLWATSGSKMFPVPGNHDNPGYETIGCPREWRHDLTDPATGVTVTLIGLDNSSGMFSDASKAIMAPPKTSQFEFVAAHMPPVVTVLPDGSLNTHGMLENNPSNPDAAWLVQQMQGRSDAMLCGHYHGFTYQQCSFGPLIVDGRGGATGETAFTLVTVTPDGWVLHSVAV